MTYELNAVLVRIGAFLWVMISLCGVGAPASAQSCNFAITNMNFGVIDPTTNAPFQTTAILSGSCTGRRNHTVTVCASLGDGQYGSNSQGSPRLMSNGSSSLLFSFYTSGSYATVWGSYVWPWSATYQGASFSVPLGHNGSGTLSATIYGEIYAGQQTVTTGAYSSSFPPPHTYVSYGYSRTGTCQSNTINAGYGQPTFTVSANYAATCALSATNMNFPNSGALTANVDATSNLSVACSNGTPYVVSLGLGNGAGVTSPTARLMTGPGGTIAYGLYQDTGRNLPWGNSPGVNTVSGTGTGYAQSLMVYGRVRPQTTPAPGTYTDVIVATVTY